MRDLLFVLIPLGTAKSFDENFAADANHKILMAIYERAMSGRSGREVQS